MPENSRHKVRLFKIVTDNLKTTWRTFQKPEKTIADNYTKIDASKDESVGEHKKHAIKEIESIILRAELEKALNQVRNKQFRG